MNNDPIIPYTGGNSMVGVDFLAAQEATYIVAESQGYIGSQITESGNSIESPVIFEYSYLAGDVVHIRGNARNTTNSTQHDYIKGFFSDTEIPLGINKKMYNGNKTYPNPFSAFLHIERNDYSPSVLEVLNTIGELVFQKVINQKKIYLDLSSLPSGIYILRIDNQVTKLLKE